MPICTNCSHPVPYLYTVYSTASNLRLEQCSNCHKFADPYVEHDTLTLVLDLILLKRDVYRHLLFNRGTGVRRVGSTKTPLNRGDNPPSSLAASAAADTHGDLELEEERTKARWFHILKLAAVLIVVDAFIRWTHLATWNSEAVKSFVRILAGCLIETIAFHIGITLSCYILLRGQDHIRRLSVRRRPGRPTENQEREESMSGIRLEFRYSHVPLTLLYSSLTKLFLLFLLSIWHPRPALWSSHSTSSDSHVSPYMSPIMKGALEILDEDKLDREWIVRNVLGGMAAGFGLRVVLDCHPAFTTMVVLAGWAVKNVVANLVSGWVVRGGDQQTKGEMWLAYSIP
ncbi:Arv1-domain-containing protein [Panus rudis PR-1116 ss-1]|nr:Arv1-domain-containing protein [Panus rudis PR-1116 ss-1]